MIAEVKQRLTWKELESETAVSGLTGIAVSQNLIFLFISWESDTVAIIGAHKQFNNTYLTEK